jgi:metal-responsive CopG/Arc/MetJ family transcriptional regulator
VTAIRLSPDLRATVDAWAEKQDDKPGRSEAIRRLVELGLSTAKPAALTSAKTSVRAKEMAGQAIDKLADPQASAEEKASRKRRLISGPEEFHEARVDRAKKK